MFVWVLFSSLTSRPVFTIFPLKLIICYIRTCPAESTLRWPLFTSDASLGKFSTELPSHVAPSSAPRVSCMHCAHNTCEVGHLGVRCWAHPLWGRARALLCVLSAFCLLRFVLFVSPSLRLGGKSSRDTGCKSLSSNLIGPTWNLPHSLSCLHSHRREMRRPCRLLPYGDVIKIAIT